MTRPRLSDGVSVVVPAFNAAGYIEAAISSALVRSEVPVEVVVVDDASTDATCAVVEQIAEADPRVRLIRLPVNGGPSRARNEAIRAARYGWVALLDADDRFVPGRLDRLAPLAEATGADIVSDEVELVTLGGARWPVVASTGWTFEPGSPIDPLDYARCLWVVQPVFRKLLAEKGDSFDEGIAYGEDALIMMRWLLKGARWTMHSAVGYEYIRRQGSLSGGGGEPRQLIDVILQMQREALGVDRPDIAGELEKRLQRARADAAFADFTRATGRRDQLRTAARLGPHLTELWRRALEGGARRARARVARWRLHGFRPFPP